MKQLRIFLFCLLSLLLVPGMLAAKDRKRPAAKKATVRTTVSLPPLSYNDSRRYDFFFLEAIRQQEAGHYDAAFDLLNHSLDVNPNAAEAWYFKAMYLSQLKQDTLAMRCLEKATMLSPENDTFQERLAQFYIGTGNYAQAIQSYERFFAVNRDRSDVLNILVQLYKQQQNYPMMLNTIGRLEQIEGPNDSFTLGKMSVYELMGDKKMAYKTLRGLADSHPNDPGFTVMLGNWLMQNKRGSEAYKLLTQVLKADPTNVYAQSSMYDYYRATGQDSLARRMMTEVLLGKNTPAQTRAMFLKQAVQECDAKGDSLGVVRLLDRMQQAMPRDTDVAEMRVAYYTLKKMPVAMIDTALVCLLKLAPDNGSARFQLIQNNWSKQNWKEIAALSEPGMLYNPDEMAFYYFTGLARYYQKDDDGALDAFRRGTSVINSKSNPDIVSDFYAIMGEIYHNKGQNDKAYAAFDSCLQWKPDQVMTLNNYAYFLSVDGKDLKKAEEMSARTIKTEPKNSTYLDTYAWILYKEGRYTEAKLYIDQALANLSDSAMRADLLEHAGDIYWAAGLREQALKYWTQAVKAGSSNAAALRQKIAGGLTGKHNSKRNNRR
uniref:tetratricopeptide repeat protein n=1 Tax=Prevotella sp. TaxID=59823 RepID=UPI0040295F32